MANYSQTFSGDFTSYVAGKVFDAANMAKGEAARRQEEGINKAKPGSLFARALQHQFGGDLYNRTFGTFDPRKKHAESDRKSSKEARFTAQFPEAEKKDDTPAASKSRKKVADATRQLFTDDDAIPVKDKDLRQQISRIFGAGVDARLVAAEAKISRMNASVMGIHTSLKDTQQLVLDQNELLLSKFDQILEIFGKQAEFQKKLADQSEADAKKRASQDLNSTTSYSTADTGGGGSYNPRIHSYFKGRLLRQLYRRTPKQLRNLRRGVRNLQRMPGRAVNRITSGAANRMTRALPPRVSNFGKNISTARSAFNASKGLRSLKSGGRNVPGLKQALAVWEYGDRKSAGQSDLQAAVGVGGGLAGAAAGAAIGTMLFPGVGTAAGLLIGAAFSAAGGFAGSKIADSMTGAEDVRGGEFETGGSYSRKNGSNPNVRLSSSSTLRQTGSALVSSAIALGDSAGYGSEIRREALKLGLDYEIRRVNYDSSISKTGSGGGYRNNKILTALASPLAGLSQLLGGRKSGVSGSRDLDPGTGEYSGLTGKAAEYYAYLRAKGLSPNHAMGIVINAERESNFNHADQHTDTNDLQVGGVLQWNGARFDAMVRAVPDWKTNWKAQLDYIWTEPSNLSGYTIDQYQSENFGSALSAANTWMRKWERPQDPAADEAKHSRIYQNYISKGLKRESTGEYKWSASEYLTTASGVKIDASGEPGVDFTPAGPNNKAMFDGIVVETGNQYNPSATGGDDRPGSGYGNFIIIRSTDAKNGKQFDSLYAHFPQGELNRWSSGDTVKRGDVLGRMATEAEFANPATRPQVGSGTGPHTSLDFFPPGGPYVRSNPYPDWKTNLLPLIDPNVAPIPPPAAKPPGWTPRSTSTHELKLEDFSNPRDYDYFISGGGNAALQQGQFLNDIIQQGKKWAGNKFNTNGGSGGPGSRTSGNTPIMGGQGGPGNTKAPKISERDYWATLAIASLEDSDPQGRADVAQALYNRLAGARAGSNYYQKSNTLYDHIIAKEQFEPTFKNKGDWIAIKNEATAITAIVNARRAHGEIISRSTARQMLQDTLKALRSGRLQQNAMSHVRGRTYFLGKSEHGNMQSGDVLRNPNDNFFSMWYDEDNAYGRNGVPNAAPIPDRFLPAVMEGIFADKVRPAGPKGLIESLKDDSGFSRFIPPALRNMLPGELNRRSSLMEDMEDAGGIRTQFVIINNTMVASADQSNDIILPSTGGVDMNQLYRMASLGA